MRAHIYACQLVGCGGWTHACAVTREVFRWEADAPSCTHTLHHRNALLPQLALPVYAPLPPHPQQHPSNVGLKTVRQLPDTAEVARCFHWMSVMKACTPRDALTPWRCSADGSFKGRHGEIAH